jgi:DNA-nicking Smr family endonuclease|tara:strand:- start:195 stop:617 length:423 start_codon:yes stop_codon:yes gene_type:complete
LKRKISDKDKKDWKNFISNKEKLSNKDLYLSNNKIEKKIIKTIDLHGFSLENANNVIEEFVIQCFKKNVNKIIVITGKGLRSKSIRNPYASKDLSILKYSVPDFIKLKPNLMKIIKKIEEAKIEDGGGGAFYIYLKNFKG